MSPSAAAKNMSGLPLIRAAAAACKSESGKHEVKGGKIRIELLG
jgi:hypothetical protein